MNRKSLFVTIGVVAVLLAAAFWAGKAIATTGCFSDTNGHWAETFICWLKDNGISNGYADGTYRPENYITRAEMAKMLQKQAEVPPDTGAILITPGKGNWLKFLAADDIVFNHYDNYTSVVKATAGEAWISIQPSIPTVLYGRRMQLVGIDFCYQATANTYLSYALLETIASTTGDSSLSIQYSDGTDRTDQACRYYTIAPSPVTLTKYDDVEFWILIHWNAGGTNFNITRTTFVLQPTDSTAAPFPDIVSPLTETNTPAQGRGSTAP